MLIDFFLSVRAAKVPCSVREYLDLVEAVQKHVAFADLDDFYALARLCLVKDEKHYDKFDKAFAAYFKGMETLPPGMNGQIFRPSGCVKSLSAWWRPKKWPKLKP